MTQNEKTNFPATYFERDTILQLDRYAKIFAWIVLIVYLAQSLLSIIVFFLQLSRGLIFIPGFTDLAQQVLWFLQPALPGLWYFIGIQAITKALLLFMDIEDNLRRIARK
jgi:hypothetical protein